MRTHRNELDHPGEASGTEDLCRTSVEGVGVATGQNPRRRETMAIDWIHDSDKTTTNIRSPKAGLPVPIM
jgi:hypothetical protein